KGESSATVGTRGILLPLFQGYRESSCALVERPPRCRVGRVSMAERLRVDRDFVKLPFPGLRVDAVGTTPEHPLGAGLKIGGYAGGGLSGRGGGDLERRAHACISPRPWHSCRCWGSSPPWRSPAATAPENPAPPS